MTTPRQTERARAHRACAARALIGEAVFLYDNHDSGLVELAVAAAEDGRAAYWRKTKYHDALTGIVCGSANSDGLAAALHEWIDTRADARNRERLTSQVLDALVPLNTLAADALQRAKARAYWHYAPGTIGAAA